jgi:hypothetical protein
MDLVPSNLRHNIDPLHNSPPQTRDGYTELSGVAESLGVLGGRLPFPVAMLAVSSHWLQINVRQIHIFFKILNAQQC